MYVGIKEQREKVTHLKLLSGHLTKRFDKIWLNIQNVVFRVLFEKKSL